jgi:hypothetical protein
MGQPAAFSNYNYAEAQRVGNKMRRMPAMRGLHQAGTM